MALIRDAIKRAAVALAGTRAGAQLLYAATAPDRRAERFREVESWPDAAQGFEDLDFLFTSSQLDHGVAALRFDEAALLYRLVRDAGVATIVEIGRFKGGSTIIMASAMAPGSTLWSYDLHVSVRADLAGVELDAELSDAMRRLGLGVGVHLLVGDSRTVDIPPGPIDLLFIDGDHSYNGAKDDAERWASHVRQGGHLLFHDALDLGGYATSFPGVGRAVAELESEGSFVAARGAGTIAHLVRVG